MDRSIIKQGKKLRLGYTTGSCAAAAAKAAGWMLLSGKRLETIGLTTPKGIRLELPIEDIEMTPEKVSCAIRKDSGDDPDVTNGTLIYASVSGIKDKAILINGGTGIGKVTKQGLDQPVGESAINSIPRKMIRENLEEISRLLDYRDGFSVLIYAPEGEELAKKTFNSRLGIVGGISILGTSGIVEPMSEQALIDTIRLELKQRKIDGAQTVILTPGNYGMDFIRRQFPIRPEFPVMTSNFIGDALDICRELAFQNIVLIGHIGKLVKIAGGMFNTHSQYGDCRMEILAAHAAASGLSARKTCEILDCITCDDALRILKEEELLDQTIRRLISRISFHLNYRTGKEPSAEVVLFSNVHGLLGMTENAASLLSKIEEER